MRALVVALIAVASFGTACTKLGLKSTARKYSSSQVVANQFIFSGDRTVVEGYLKAQGIEGTFELLSAEDSFYLVRYKGEHDLGQIVTDLKEITNSVGPNEIVQSVASMRKADWPTDKYFFKQWALNNIGQSAPFGLPGVRGADMDILKAWEKVTKGSDKVVVAVIDTGVDYTHPDLKDNMWVNEKESEANGGVPGVDDDGNGYIDDVYGYDFVSTNRTGFRGVPGDADPMDDNGHGTHCASAIGAVPANGMGVAGVNWKVKIMAVRFLGPSGGTIVDAYRAVRYARENGAHIMSNSWGGGSDESELFKSELRRVEEKGILFVAAAGNSSSNNDVKPTFPAAFANFEYRGKKFTNVITVAASDNQDTPADFSNYGHESVNVFAPGVAILGAYPLQLTPAGRPPYATMSGTSMAAPYVSGVAALMMAANPSLMNQPQEIVRIMEETADVKETLVGRVRSNGRINAYRAVTAEVTDAKKTPVWHTKAHVIDQRRFQTDLVDIRHEIKVEGASSVKVHFDFLQIDEPYDSVYLYDKDLRLVARVEKNLVDDFWSPAVPGDTVYVRFVNSLVQQVKMMPFKGSSESECVSRGALSVVKTVDGFACDVDSENSSDGSKKYTSFNSEGFRIDQIAYVKKEEK